ncbi:MAG TPA: hypothetical protein VFS29_02815, partial [Motilibacteraceae bacterium]|nr:hypothetical protein [Motilibacteraceae bacterium]
GREVQVSQSEDPQVVEAADALYAVPPDRFVAERTARVAALRAAGDKPAAAAVAALRRPTRPAWLVNLLVRERADVVEQLLTLGEDLREATEQLDAASLRTLSAQRRAVVDALVREAAALAEQAGSAADADVRRAVQETLEAALGDPEVAAAVRTGRLVGPREAGGFGPVAPGPLGLPKAARPAGPRGKAAAEGKRPEPAADRSRRERAEREEAARRAKQQAAAEAAERALREAREQLAAAEAAREEARRDADAARQRVEELRAQLVDAERRAAAAALDERAAVRAEERARHALERVERRR